MERTTKFDGPTNPMAMPPEFPQRGKIFELIPKIMADLKAVARDQVNEQQKFKYRGIDDLYNALGPLLAKHGVFTVPRVVNTNRTERTSRNGGAIFHVELMIDYTFYASDGSSFVATLIGEGMDSGDKAANKAESVAHKYALTQVFAVRTEDQNDPDGETVPHVAAKPAAKSPAKPAAKPPAEAPPQADWQKKPLTKKQSALIFAYANQLGYSNDDAKGVIKQMFKKNSTKDLTGGEASLLIDKWKSLIPPDPKNQDNAGVQK